MSSHAILPVETIRFVCGQVNGPADLSIERTDTQEDHESQDHEPLSPGAILRAKVRQRRLKRLSTALHAMTMVLGVAVVVLAGLLYKNMDFFGLPCTFYPTCSALMTTGGYASVLTSLVGIFVCWKRKTSSFMFSLALMTAGISVVGAIGTFAAFYESDQISHEEACFTPPDTLEICCDTKRDERAKLKFISEVLGGIGCVWVVVQILAAIFSMCWGHEFDRRLYNVATVREF